jgi:hypothetical protein
MKNLIFFFVFFCSSNLLFGQAVGTPFIFETYKAPYVYQNIVTSYDGSTFTGWENGFGADNQMSIDNGIGNPSPSFISTGSNCGSCIRTMRRDFGQNFKNKIIEFDIRLQSGKAGFAFGCDVNGANGVGLTLNAGNSSINGLQYNTNWYYTNNAGDNYNFSTGQWYAIKIETGDGTTGTIKWYVNGVYQGTNSSNSTLGNYGYFGIATMGNAIFYVDNIKITY